MAFQKEPSFQHGQAPRTAVLYCNLGTPSAPTAPALRKYLAEFLGDSRVVEIPKPIWLLILHGIILRVRPAKSAAKYASIWTEQGSPLKAFTEQQSQSLGTALQERGHHVSVRYAMRYGQPSIPSQLSALKAEGVQRVLIVPAYPQYSGTSTALNAHNVLHALRTFIFHCFCNRAFITCINQNNFCLGIIEYVGKFVGYPVPVNGNIGPPTMGTSLSNFEPLTLVASHHRNGVAGSEPKITQAVH